MSEKIRVPAWASQITVQEKRDKLVVTGQGRVMDLALFGRDPSARGPALMDGYISLQKGVSPPHLQFADAVRRDNQIAFVKKFGPIWGKVKKQELGTTAEIVVDQKLSDLSEDQRMFRLAAAIASEARAARPDLDFLGLVFLEIHRKVPFLEDGHMNTLEAVSNRIGCPVSLWDDEERSLPPAKRNRIRKEFVLHLANWALCRLFNLFPVHLTYLNGRVIELPHHSPEGVLPMLYYLLRRDYMDEAHGVRMCANSTCGKLFTISRARQRFCCSDCSALQRGREYWHRSGKKRREERSQRNVNVSYPR